MTTENAAALRILKSKYPGLSVPAYNGVLEAWRVASASLGKEPIDFFLCDRLESKDPPKTTWGSAWFLFEDDSLIEYYSFLSQRREFDLTNARHAHRIKITCDDFDPALTETSATAEVKVEGKMFGDIYFDMTAVGPNCLNLLEFIRRLSAYIATTGENISAAPSLDSSGM